MVPTGRPGGVQTTLCWRYVGQLPISSTAPGASRYSTRAGPKCRSSPASLFGCSEGDRRVVKGQACPNEGWVPVQPGHAENARIAAVISDRDAGHSTGSGFVEVSSNGEADAAITALNGQDHGGRALTVNEARSFPPFGAGKMKRSRTTATRPARYSITISS